MPILGGLKSVGGAVKNSIKKFVRRTPSSGSGKNSAPSSRVSTRSNRSANAINRKTSVNKTNLSGRSGSAPTRGLSYSPYGNSSTTTSNPYQRPSSPPGTNFSINTRGTSALSKGLGGAAITKAGVAYTKAFAKYGPLGLAVLLIADIVLADRGLSDGTIPEHLRQPGESQKIQDGVVPFTGGQMPDTYYIAYGTAQNNNGVFYWIAKGHPHGFLGSIAGYSLLRPASNGDAWRLFTYHDNGKEYFSLLNKYSKSEIDRGNYPTTISSFSRLRYFSSGDGSNTATSVTIEGFKPVDNSEDTGGNPEPEGEINSSSTTNNDNIKVEASSNTFPSSIRPPFPSNETAKDNFEPSKSFNRPPDKPPVVKKATTETPRGGIEPSRYNGSNQNSNNSSTNTQQPKLEAPTEIPEPIPEPEQPVDKTLEEEQVNATSTEEPDIISKTKRRRPDGTIETVTQREATSEELDQFNKDLNDANRQLEEAKEVIELDREFRDFEIDPERRFPFGRPKSLENLTLEEIDRFPFGKPDRFKNQSPSKPPASDNNSSEPPEPDREPDSEPTPEPVKETKVSDDPISDKIDNLPSLEEITVAVAGLDIIQQIAKKAGSASPVCLAPALVPPVSAKVTANNKAILGFQALNTTQNVGIQATVNVVNRTTNTIAQGVTKVQSTLGKMQQFAETAWKALGADKVMQTVSAVASLHNAAMLSQNAAQSIGDVITNGLRLFNVKGFDGQPIDVNAAVGGAIRNKLVSVFGETNLNAASEAWLRLNRIHQAVSSTVYAIQGTKNALLEADEITGGHIAKIGNALQEQGMVEDNTYDWMNPEPNYQQPFKGILGKIDNIEDMTSRVSSVVSTGLEIKENTTELVTSVEELDKATTDFLKLKNEDESTKKAESESPDIDRNDLVRDETDEDE